MAKAKVTPAKLEPEQKQIVLTQEQYDVLMNIYQTLDDATDQISELTNGELSQIQLGYKLGMINNDLQMAHSQLDTLTDEINPADNWWEGDEDGGEDK